MNAIAKQIPILLLFSLALAAASLFSCSNDPLLHITPAELAQRIQSSDRPILLDVRTPKEFSEGHIPGALNIPHKELKTRLPELAPHKKEMIVVYCRSGRRTGFASTILRDGGFQHLLSLEGQMPAWESAGLPVEK